MSNMYGRQTVIPLVNKSGGSVAAGDVVIVDTSNNDAFTTTTTGAFTGAIGVAQETIASNATGRVLTAGYAALVNVNASVTRGHFVKTHTVAKQGTDAGTSRIAGTFGIFLTGGTTPDAIIWQADLGGGSGELVASSAIWTTSGKVAVATGTATATEQWPPGHEFNYTESTSNVTINTTSEGTANTVITSGSVTYDGSTIVFIEFFSPRVISSDTSGGAIVILLYEDSTLLGRFGLMKTTAATPNFVPVHLLRRRTPSNAAHTYTVKAYSTSGTTGSEIDGGAGGTGIELAMFIRIYKV